jgi:FkbM family methyltransferase
MGLPFETDEQQAMSRIVLPGDTAYDVGAHLGVHSLLLSRLVGPGGRVCAFEPNEAVLPALQRTLEPLKNTSLYRFALADDSGPSHLFVPPDQSMASLADWTAPSPGTTPNIPCQTHRIDDLVSTGLVPKPDFIKCDVEGAELLVLHGARDTLNNVDAPALLFEAGLYTTRGFGLTPACALRFLAGLTEPHYQFFQLGERGTIVRVEAPSSAHSNIVGIPRAKLGRLHDIV